MKEKIYFEQISGEYLILETKTGEIGWYFGDENLPNLQLKSLHNLIDKKGVNYLITRSDDIKVTVIEPNSKVILKILSNKKKHIFKSNENLGELKFDINNKEFENLNQYGGILISIIQKTNKMVVFIMSNLPAYEKYTSTNKVNIVKEEQIITDNLLKNKISEEYIEATLKLPKNLINNNNQEVLDLLIINNSLLNEFHSDINHKLNYLNKTIKSERNNEYIINNQENTILDLNLQLDKLLQDRKMLESERKKAELIALNKIKRDLKMSILAIEKQIDIDDVESSRDKVQDLLLDVLKFLDFGKKDIEEVLKNEIINDKINSLADNHDTKIQSLLDIRDDFLFNKIIVNSKGD